MHALYIFVHCHMYLCDGVLPPAVYGPSPPGPLVCAATSPCGGAPSSAKQSPAAWPLWLLQPPYQHPPAPGRAGRNTTSVRIHLGCKLFLSFSEGFSIRVVTLTIDAYNLTNENSLHTLVLNLICNPKTAPLLLGPISNSQ